MKITPEDLYAAARELAQDDTSYLPRLARLVALEVRANVDESQTGTRRAATVHRIPWNTPAADAYYDVHAAVRRHESSLTLLLFGHAKYRGGTDDLTFDAVRRLPVLIAHALDAGHEHHTVTQEATAALLSWPRLARLVLDEAGPDEQPWTKAPGDLSCPFCGNRLELEPGWTTSPENADVYCRRCKDSHGAWLRWAPSEWTGRVLSTEPDGQTDEDGTPLVTAREAAALLPGLAAATVRTWAHRGHLTAAGSRPDGAQLYRLTDIEDRLAARTAC